mmetsp:Transcript_28364/g.48184  ORF Transcript_28364/g.48184 Transcript_28364/m.48184 type:complete len:83 (-) Transcript_28364:845-1093(-)
MLSRPGQHPVGFKHLEKMESTSRRTAAHQMTAEILGNSDMISALLSKAEQDSRNDTAGAVGWVTCSWLLVPTLEKDIMACLT